ncbi:MAG TPA: substrate-binding domain-containing protein [Candidatus Baltobacteraceae bacterium]|jgi:molybdate transport system substrate-binding protein
MLAFALLPLVILCAGATSSVVDRIAAEFGHQTSRAVIVRVGTVGQIQLQLARHEAADVVIVSGKAMKSLTRRRAIVPGTRADLGRSGMGIGVRAGAPLPDISSTEALKRTLLAARSIAATDPKAGASSGIYFKHMLVRMGIAATVAPKETLVPGGHSCDLVARGKAELCAQNITEIVPVKGVALVGPFPAGVQNYITYSAAVLTRAASPDAARAFVSSLSAPRRAPLWRHAGFAPS